MFYFISQQNASLSQHLSSSRSIGISAATSTSQDINSIDWNPAGLTSILDWRLDLTTYFNPTLSNSALAFYNFCIAKKISDKHTIAVRYSPGATLEFIIPTTFKFLDADDNPVVTKFDKKILYSQLYSFGYASKVFQDFSIGTGVRFYETKISDTKYSLDTNNIIKSQILDYYSSQWNVDLGGIFKFQNNINVGIVFKNLFTIRESELNENLKIYQLVLPKTVRFGTSYTTYNNIIIALDVDSRKNLNLGFELPTTQFLKLNAGIYSNDLKKFVSASIGLNYIYQNFMFDLSYLKFFDQTNRKGVANLQSFYESNYTDIDYTPFTSDRLSFSVGINLGKTKEQFVKIEYVEIIGEVFPSAYQTYAFRPIGKARIKNISSKAVEAKVSFYINKFMDEPTQSKPLKIFSGEVIEVPLFAVFNNAIKFVKSFSIHDANVFVYAEPTNDFDDNYQTPIIIRGRNDWNGDISQLKYFITPNDPEVMMFARRAIQFAIEKNDNVILNKFENAKTIFNELSKVITYVNDPNQSYDYVQYPAETLNLHGGDCDDITVCYSALLESVGIKVALIDVVPPENPKNSHIYMMFDTEIPVEKATLLTDNSKRYIIRKNQSGKETVWIPVETTLITKGFMEAWEYGAKEYFNNAVLNNALSQGWMRIVDLNLNY